MRSKDADKEEIVHEQLIAQYEKYYRIAYSYTFHEQDALDIVQEGAYRAILKSDTLKDPEYVDTWICRIMMNEAVRYLERYRRESVSIEEVPEEGAPDRMGDPDLRAALSRLDDTDRAIVVLRYFEEEKLDSIAWMLDMNVNTVKSRLYRAMDKLKADLEGEGENG